jgi:hypothetical protein
MMRWLLLVFAFLAWPALADVRDPHAHFFMQNMGDFKEELATAQAEGKQGVLIMFEMDDCPFCTRMKANILNQTVVQDYYRKHFLIYPVNVKGDTPMVDFKGKDTTEKALPSNNGRERRRFSSSTICKAIPSPALPAPCRPQMNSCCWVATWWRAATRPRRSMSTSGSRKRHDSSLLAGGWVCCWVCR